MPEPTAPLTAPVDVPVMVRLDARLVHQPDCERCPWTGEPTTDYAAALRAAVDHQEHRHG